MDSLPPRPPPSAASDPTPGYVFAPGEIYPVGPRERALCGAASHTDWGYLAALAQLDAVVVWAASTDTVKYSSSVPLRTVAPTMIGLVWGATLGGSWLALPKCSSEWVGEAPLEGAVRSEWPLALSLSLLAGATAPIVNGIAIGYVLPQSWSTFEREMHLVAAGIGGAVGAMIPYLIPPRTWAAARELNRLRVRFGPRGEAFIGIATPF